MAPPPVSRNRLLCALPAADRRRLAPKLTLVSLELKESLEEANTTIDRVYFMEEGIASVVAVAVRRRIEVGLIGPEGMTGLAILLGDNRSPNETYVQAVGAARWITVKDLHAAMRASKTLRPILLRFVHGFLVQTAHTAIANGTATISQRLARWVLMAHDRLGRDHMPLTHEFLSLMLGVRRAGVTEAINLLAGERLIRSSPGVIVVLDRLGLERRAGESYGIPEAEYRRLFA